MDSKLQKVLNSINQVILGKEQQIRLCLTCLLARGHLLLEDLPGMGKTTLSHTLANVLGLSYQRIQFTADILPGDILGGSIYNQETQEFKLYKGPVFTEVLLADEINRATPKSQSALLEAMEERQVTLDRTTHALPEHFFVIATQNPMMMSSGTFPLPDSQLDRFLMRISLGYPSKEAEFKMLTEVKSRNKIKQIQPLLTKDELTDIQNTVQQTHVSNPVLDYILRIVFATRSNPQFEVGVSPRASLALLNTSKAYAFIMGRDYVIPDDIQAVLQSVFEHRLNHGTSKNNAELIQWLLKNIPPIQ